MLVSEPNTRSLSLQINIPSGLVLTDKYFHIQWFTYSNELYSLNLGRHEGQPEKSMSTFDHIFNQRLSTRELPKLVLILQPVHILVPSFDGPSLSVPNMEVVADATHNVTATGHVLSYYYSPAAMSWAEIDLTCLITFSVYLLAEYVWHYSSSLRLSGNLCYKEAFAPWKAVWAISTWTEGTAFHRERAWLSHWKQRSRIRKMGEKIRKFVSILSTW